MMPALICATPRAPKAPQRGLRRRSPRLEAVARNGNGESELEGRARLAESNSDKCQRARLHRREFRERRRRQTAAASLLLCQCRRQPASRRLRSHRRPHSELAARPPARPPPLPHRPIPPPTARHPHGRASPAAPRPAAQKYMHMDMNSTTQRELTSCRCNVLYYSQSMLSSEYRAPQSDLLTIAARALASWSMRYLYQRPFRRTRCTAIQRVQYWQYCS